MDLAPAARRTIAWHAVAWHAVTWHVVTRHAVTWHRAAAAALLAAVATGCAADPATTHAGPGSPRPTGAVRASGAPVATGWLPADPAMPDVCQARLPAQAHDTLLLIGAGGPYPYRADDTVFQNRERRLPRRSGGYYHEFTVRTPGSGDRGARRIIVGRGGEEYWTADHYGSFKEIDSRC
ncbi:ribonuclease domain-containing protein [Streptomyces sp. NPDC092296]|uniref:ribonuclease domain-containing protein n=1 Tax=Streptomyces sp. NPDC092296 TaxID=3366012 RepID=UPI0038263A43